MFIFDIAIWLFLSGVGCLPGWGVCLVVGWALLMFKISSRYDEAFNNLRRSEIAGGKNASKFLGIVGLLSVGLGVAGYVLKFKGCIYSFSINALHTLFNEGSYFDFSKFSEKQFVIWGVLVYHRVENLFYGIVLITMCVIMRKLRKRLLIAWPMQRNIPKEMFYFQWTLRGVLPGIVMLTIPNMLGRHLTGIENPGQYVIDQGFIGNVSVGDSVYFQILAIYVLLFIATVCCIEYWITITRVAESIRGKICVAVIAFPFCALMAYVIVRCFYASLGIILPMFLLLGILFFVLASVGSSGDKKSDISHTAEDTKYNLRMINALQWNEKELQKYLSNMSVYEKIDVQIAIIEDNNYFDAVMYEKIRESMRSDL